MEAISRPSFCRLRLCNLLRIALKLRILERHYKLVFTKTPKRPACSQLEETVLPKSNSIMSSPVTQKLTGHPSGSTPCKTGNGFKMLRWTCLSIWAELSRITGLEKDTKFHSRPLTCGKVTPPWKSNRLVHSLQIAPQVRKLARMVATGPPRLSAPPQQPPSEAEPWNITSTSTCGSPVLQCP